jgi:hypothetical protein
MRHTAGPWARALLLAAALQGTGPAVALQEGRTAAGWAWLTGGVSHEELVALRARRDDFNLWVITAAARSGAHLAEARVTVRDAQRQVVFDGPLDGPWLFIDLPAGRYEVAASVNGGDGRWRRTTLHRGDRRQIFFYFDTGDEVAPENRSPFDGSPYGDAPGRRPKQR